MSDNEEADRIRQEVVRLLDQGFLEYERAAAIAVGQPLGITGEEGNLHSWFVPLVAGQKITGFAQLLPSLEVMRVSSFQRGPGDFAACPDLADWIDPLRVRERAGAFGGEGEVISEPVFTFDGNPNRLAWKVVLKSSLGQTRVIFVAGTTAYEQRQ